jgi:hypothetical protein
VEQALCRRRGEEDRDARGAYRLAKDRDPLGIAPEAADVALHPPQRCNLIEQSVVAGGMML